MLLRFILNVSATPRPQNMSGRLELSIFSIPLGERKTFVSIVPYTSNGLLPTITIKIPQNANANTTEIKDVIIVRAGL
jgi:hypothetical protein